MQLCPSGCRSRRGAFSGWWASLAAILILLGIGCPTSVAALDEREAPNGPEGPNQPEWSPVLEVALEVPPQGVLPEMPIWVNYRVANTSSAPVMIPVRPSPENGSLAFWMISPGGTRLEPLVKMCEAPRSLRRLAPGDAVEGSLRLPAGANGQYLFFAEGEYRLFLRSGAGLASNTAEARIFVDHMGLVLDADSSAFERVRRIGLGEAGPRLEAVHPQRAVDGDPEQLREAFIAHQEGTAWLETLDDPCAASTDEAALLRALRLLERAHGLAGAKAPYLSQAAVRAMARAHRALGDDREARELMMAADGLDLPFFSAAQAEVLIDPHSPWRAGASTPGLPEVDEGAGPPEGTEPSETEISYGFSFRDLGEFFARIPPETLAAFNDEVDAELDRLEQEDPRAENEPPTMGSMGSFDTPWGKLILPYRLVDGQPVSGDMGLDPEWLIGGAIRSTFQEISPKLVSAVAPSAWTSLWPRGVVPFEVKPHDATLANTVKQAIGLYEAATLLTFPDFAPAVHHDGHVIFRVGPAKGGRGYSDWIGRKGTAPNVVELREDYRGNLATVAHEIGHAIGLFHEQSRSDRNTYVEVKPWNIDANQIDNFARNSAATTQNIGPYDPHSMMHYTSETFLKSDWLYVKYFFCNEPLGFWCDSRDYASILKKTSSGGRELIGWRKAFSSGAEIDKLYADSSRCQGVLPGGQQDKLIDPSKYQARKIQMSRCNRHSYTFITKAYYDLQIDFRTSGKGGDDVQVELITPDDRGQPARFGSKKVGPGHWRITRKGQSLAGWKGLLPGFQRLELMNWYNGDVQVELSIDVAASVIPKDGGEPPNDALSTATSVDATALASPWLNTVYAGGSLHQGNDVDYYDVQLPNDERAVQLESDCSSTGPSTGSKGEKLVAGELALLLNVKHQGLRPLTLTVYDELGQPVKKEIFFDHDWQQKKVSFPCPFTYQNNGHAAFPTGQMRFSVSSKLGKVAIYETRVVFDPTQGVPLLVQLPELLAAPSFTREPGGGVWSLPKSEFIVDPKDFDGLPGQIKGDQAEFVLDQVVRLRKLAPPPAR